MFPAFVIPVVKHVYLEANAYSLDAGINASIIEKTIEIIMTPFTYLWVG
jgi:hypothetical protein